MLLTKIEYESLPNNNNNNIEYEPVVFLFYQRLGVSNIFFSLYTINLFFGGSVIVRKVFPLVRYS